MQLSAFVDGELPENEAELLLRRLSQDAELRQDVAEYLAMGRLIRSEAGLAGADRLHERVAAELDERPSETEVVGSAAVASRAIRPLAGLAIVASVALVGIFALQQTSSVDELPAEMPVPVVNEIVPNFDAQQERQRQFFQNHSETSSDLGANGMNSRVVTLRFSEDVLEDPEENQSDEIVEADDTSTQP